MRCLRRILVAALCGCGAVSALAQHDNTVWHSFRANNDKTGSVSAPGPAIELAWTLGTGVTTLGTCSSGGFTIGVDGSIYYKSNDDDALDPPNNGPAYVFRLAPDGSSVVRSPANLNGNVGNYSGVAVGTTELYTTTNDPINGSRIVVLNKTTLATLREYTGFNSLRGTPLISDLLNVNGHHNLYVADRGAVAIVAVDAVTGQVMWSYTTPTSHVLGALGPMWVTPQGKQALAFFGNNPLGPGVAIADNGDSTFQVLWQDMGPDSFNWWGSGVMSADRTRIYVTTFNDNNVPTLWAIRVSDGSIIWSVPGNRGQADERNYFGRPAVVEDRIYCGGGFGVVTCFEDLGSTYELKWEYRDQDDEHTAISAATDPGSNITYVYASKQGNDGSGAFICLRDDGNNYTVMLNTDLNGRMMGSNFGGNGLTIDAQGSVYVGSGIRNAAPARVYKFAVAGGCDPCDMTCDGEVNAFDIENFIDVLFNQEEPCSSCAGDVNGDNQRNAFDIEPFIACLFGP